MPLTAITIENFKGIEGPVTIPLKPVTLLFGANSAGKSTVLHALQYLWEVLENRNLDVDRTTIGGATVDFGGFRNLIHKHELDRTMRFTLEFEGIIDSDDSYWPQDVPIGLVENGWILEEFVHEFNINDIAGDRRIKCFSYTWSFQWDDGLGSAKLIDASVGIDGEPFIAAHGDPMDPDTTILTLSTEHPAFRYRNISSSGVHEGTLHSLVQFVTGSELRWSLEDVREMLENLPEDKVRELHDDLKRQLESDESQVDAGPEEEVTLCKFNQPLGVFSDRHRPMLRATTDIDASRKEALLDPSLAPLLELLFSASAETILHEVSQMRYLGPLRKVPERGYLPVRRHARERWADGLAAWDSLARLNFDPFGLPLVECTSEYLNDLLGMNYSLRQEHAIQLPEDGEEFNTLRLMAKQFEDVEQPELEELVENIRKLPRETRIRIRDEKTGTDVTPHDIGVGVSQTVPVIVGAIDPNCTIFAVEQPELHVHPAVQSKMGDLFLLEAFHDRDSLRTFLLETHSEHLILRMLRRIRETTDGELPEGYPPIKPDDIQVVYVKSENGKVTMHPLPITPDGDFQENWPDGFFTEREEDLF